MQLRLLLFGIAKEIVGDPKLDIVLEDGDNINSLKQSLISRFPEMSKLKTISFAVNDEYVADSHRLSDNDEVVIIPPVSGG